MQFLGAGSLEGKHVAALGIHARHNVLNHAIFAGGIHGLENEEHRPTVLGVELLLEVAKKAATISDDFFGVVFVLEVAGIGGSEVLETKVLALADAVGFAE